MSASYPIGAVTKLTGLPLDTLRAWERRYGAVVPARSPRGRLYSEDQVKRLILLRQVVEQGHAIGQIAAIKDRELRALLEKNASMALTASDEMLVPVLRALERFDYSATDREINRLAASIANPRDFVHQAALPLMRTIGQRWHDGKCSIVQEHILTHHLSALLSSLVRTYSRSNSSGRVLLATVSGERHEFPILAAAMLVAAGGLDVIYVGSDLPAADIVLAARRTDAMVVLLSQSMAPGTGALESWAHIARKLPRGTALWLGGPPELDLHQATAGSLWLVLNDFSALEHQLTAMGGRY
ncbi:MAG: MerR family transcriptional regulator [Terriglobales bacterium]|jgi:methanogenic corrinoid protein MtbC1